MGDVLFAPGSLSEGGIRRGSSSPTEFPVALDMLFYYELLRLLVCMVFIKGDCCGKAWIDALRVPRRAEFLPATNISSFFFQAYDRKWGIMPEWSSFISLSLTVSDLLPHHPQNELSYVLILKTFQFLYFLLSVQLRACSLVCALRVLINVDLDNYLTCIGIPRLNSQYLFFLDKI